MKLLIAIFVLVIAMVQVPAYAYHVISIQDHNGNWVELCYDDDWYPIDCE